MNSWLCGAPPARPPHPSAIRALIKEHLGAIVSINSLPTNNGVGTVRGIGIVIHPSLILTTHSTVPSPACLANAYISFCSDVPATSGPCKRRFLPHVFFETSVNLDLTVVSCEIILESGIAPLVLDTTKSKRRFLRKGHIMLTLGCQTREASNLVAIFTGSILTVVGDIRAGQFLRFHTEDHFCMPGSAGFDEFGNFAFIVSKPPRVHEDPYAVAIRAVADNFLGLSKPIKQWGTTIHSIRQWLEPLWRVNRDELFKTPSKAQPLRRPPQVHEANSNPSPAETEDVPEPVAQPIAPEKREQKAEKNWPAEENLEDPLRDFLLEAEDVKPCRKLQVVAPKPAQKLQGTKNSRKPPKKKHLNKATGTVPQETDSVSVQTEDEVQSRVQNELVVVPPLVLSQFEHSSGEADQSDEELAGRRSRWTMPTNIEKFELLSCTPGRRLVRSSSAIDAKPQTGGARSWVDSLSIAPGPLSKSEQASAATSQSTTPPPQQRLDSADTADRSLRRAMSTPPTESVYTKPTMSFMKKCNTSQRKAIEARRASMNTFPRWT